MKNAIIFASIGEATTALALLADPSLVGWLLLGRKFPGVGVITARIAGAALIGLSVAKLTWPSSGRHGDPQRLRHLYLAIWASSVGSRAPSGRRSLSTWC